MSHVCVYDSAIFMGTVTHCDKVCVAIVVKYDATASLHIKVLQALPALQIILTALIFVHELAQLSCIVLKAGKRYCV